MDLIITNNPKIPNDLKTSWHIREVNSFETDLSSANGMSFNETTWFDFSYLTEEIYEKLKDYINIGKDIRFYMIKGKDIPKFTISESIKEYDEKETSFALRSNMCVIGGYCSGKTTVVNKLINELKMGGNCEIEVLQEKASYPDAVDMSVEEIIEKLEGYKDEMMNRFKIMEKRQISNIRDIDENYPRKIIVLDDVHNLLLNENYRYVNKIKDLLGSIVRLGKAAGINFIIAITPLDFCTYLPINIIRCLTNYIVVGNNIKTVTEDINTKNNSIPVFDVKSKIGDAFILQGYNRNTRFDKLDI